MHKSIITSLILLLIASTTYSKEVDKLGFLLELRKELELSEDHSEQIRARRVALRKFLVHQRAKIEIAGIDLGQLKRNREGNLQSIKEQLDRIHLMQSALQFEVIRTDTEAMEELTNEQRQVFGQLLEKRYYIQRKKEERVKKERAKFDFRSDVTDAEIGKVKAAMRELNGALERNPDSENAGQWKEALQEYESLLHECHF